MNKPAAPESNARARELRTIIADRQEKIRRILAEGGTQAWSQREALANHRLRIAELQAELHRLDVGDSISSASKLDYTPGQSD